MNAPIGHFDEKWALPKLPSDNATGFSSDQYPFCSNLIQAAERPVGWPDVFDWQTQVMKSLLLFQKPSPKPAS
jgi:hypothetical protein